ncbi:MAG: DUF2508 family protein [Bacillota bacterium]
MAPEVKFADILKANIAIQEAKTRLDLADDPELVDAAIYELAAAEKRLNYLLRQARGVVIIKSGPVAQK